MKIFLLILFQICLFESSTGQCGQTLFTNQIGDVYSLAPYQRGVSCVYKIKPRYQGRFIHLQWSKFEVDGEMPNCDKDSVEIYAG